MGSGTMRHPKKAAFLAAYAECGNISTACKAADINRNTYYVWAEHDGGFAAAAAQARQDAAEKLEAFAREWATLGIPTVKEVYERAKVQREVKGGEADGATVVEDALILVSREESRNISPTLLIFLLKGAMPEKYKDRQQTEHVGIGGAPLTIEYVHDWRNARSEQP
jgi:hypothetical protein